MDGKNTQNMKEKWNGLHIEEFGFNEIEEHIVLQARSGNCCCTYDCFTTTFC